MSACLQGIAASILAFAFISSALATEVCHRNTGGQYAETRTCVTSVLPRQGNNSYGPNQIEGDGDGAWCEGVAGPGIGESVTVHQKPAQKIGSMIFVNGYAKTHQLFRANGRVKRARIENSSGYVGVVTLKDTTDMQTIKMPAAKISWARLTILEAYSGERHSDTCISKLYFDHEEFGALEEPK